MRDAKGDLFQEIQPLLALAENAISKHLDEAIRTDNLPAEVRGRTIGAGEAQQLAIEVGGINNLLTSSDRLISATIITRGIETRDTVEKLLQKHLTQHSSAWREQSDSPLPIRRLTYLIPAIAMPNGWATSKNVPTHFEVLIKVFEDKADDARELPRLKIMSGDKALVMKGGGIKGLAYLGALEVLWKRHQFNWFVGTSAGAITAVLLGAGYNPEELIGIMKSKDFREFFDSKGFFRKVSTLISHHGLHHALEFTAWLDALLKDKITLMQRVRLSDLPHRVTVFASRADGDPIEYDKIRNDTFASHAVRCSMSIPFVFVPQSDQGFFTYDGGLQNNFPVRKLLEIAPDVDFISLYLGNAYEGPRRRSLLDVFSHLSKIFMESGDRSIVDEYRSQTVDIDPRPIGTLDFSLTDDEKNFLLASGRAAGLKFLKVAESEIGKAESARIELKEKVETARQRKGQSRRFRRRMALVLFLGFASYFLHSFSPISSIVTVSLGGALATDAAARRLRPRRRSNWLGSATFAVSCTLSFLVWNSIRSRGDWTVIPVGTEMQLIGRLNSLPDAPKTKHSSIYRMQVKLTESSKGATLEISAKSGVSLAGASLDLKEVHPTFDGCRIEGRVATKDTDFDVDLSAKTDVGDLLPSLDEAHTFFKVRINGHELNGRRSDDPKE